MKIYEYGGNQYEGAPAIDGVQCRGCHLRETDGCASAPCEGNNTIMVRVLDIPSQTNSDIIQAYQRLCVRTCVPHQAHEMSAKEMDLLHAAMGISTEANELLDNLKKTFYYGKPFDEVNFKEELGDALWYIGMICERMGWQMDDIMNTNIAKLRARYPEKFTEHAAQNRDLEKEREILEGPLVSVVDLEEQEAWCGVC